jgi:hypothetical protein
MNMRAAKALGETLPDPKMNRQLALSWNVRAHPSSKENECFQA